MSKNEKIKKGPEVAKLQQFGENCLVDAAAVSTEHLLLPCASQVVAEVEVHRCAPAFEGPVSLAIMRAHFQHLHATLARNPTHVVTHVLTHVSITYQIAHSSEEEAGKGHTPRMRKLQHPAKLGCGAAPSSSPAAMVLGWRDGHKAAGEARIEEISRTKRVKQSDS